SSQIYYFGTCPISHVPVAVCRSVGSGTRGPPVAWGAELLKTSDRQLEAKPAQPALRRRRGLKQRRSGLLWSFAGVQNRLGSPKRLVHPCQQLGAGSPQSQPRQTEAVRRVSRPKCVPIAHQQGGLEDPHHRGGTNPP